MTALARPAGFPGARWMLAVGVLCVLLGITAGINPKYAVAAVFGLAFVAIVFVDLTLGVAVFTVLSCLDLLSAGAAVSFTKLAGLLLFISWAARSATGPRKTLATVAGSHPGMIVLLVLFLAWNAISSVWALSPGAALGGSFRAVLVLLLIPIYVSAVQERRHVILVTAAFLAGAVISALYGIVNPPAQLSSAAGIFHPGSFQPTNTRLQGGLGDPNIEASVLVPALVLSLGLAVLVKRSRVKLALTLGGAILAFIGLVSTQSRTGLAAFACVLAAGVVLGGRWRRAAATILVIGVAAVVGYYAIVASSSAVSRVTSADTTGRSDLWTVAERMFAAHPINGVGASNFPIASVHYLHQPGLITAGAFIVSIPKVAHNIYLEQLATLGLPGLLLLLAIFGTGIAAAMRAARIFAGLGDRDLEILTRCTVLALIAFMAADFFISNLLSKQLWIVFAMCAALLGIAERQLARSRTAAP